MELKKHELFCSHNDAAAANCARVGRISTNRCSSTEQTKRRATSYEETCTLLPCKH